ncbi:DUF222 domain-containing protein, partial [Mycobacterium doricum]|uniref:13E12 repeat family protein n=1 Tax=Mycolicibacterium doricum TaxID=126673 RepID=UPI0021F33CCA
MFDTVFAGLDESALIAAIGQSAREEAQAGARKFAAIAQIGAALNIGHKRASGQMRIAVALRDRLPRIAALYLQGRLSTRLICEITWRTRLVEDTRVLALLDAALAGQAQRWGPLSDERLTRAVDAVINRYDP